MKNFRKPYISLFLSLLLLFVSCQPNEYLDDTNSESLENFISKQLLISEKLSHYVANQDEMMTKLNSEPEIYHSRFELNEYLRKNNIENSEEIADMIFDIQELTNNFLINSSYLNQYSEEEIKSIFANEIEKQMTSYSVQGKSYCGDRYNTAQNRCDRNYAISLTGLAVSAFITFGVGTVVGAGVAATIHAICRVEAHNDFKQCIGVE